MPERPEWSDEYAKARRDKTLATVADLPRGDQLSVLGISLGIVAFRHNPDASPEAMFHHLAEGLAWSLRTGKAVVDEERRGD